VADGKRDAPLWQPEQKAETHEAMAMKRARAKAIRRRRRRGAATLDYILVLGVILPLAASLMGLAPRMIRLVYEMLVVMVGSPVM